VWDMPRLGSFPHGHLILARDNGVMKFNFCIWLHNNKVDAWKKFGGQKKISRNVMVDFI